MGRASRSKRLRREQLAAGHQALAERMQSKQGGESYKVMRRRTGRKMSEMVLELADPWLKQAKTDEARRGMISMAIVAWNLAVLPESKRWNTISPDKTEQIGERGLSLLKAAVARKLELFPNEDRPILDYEIAGSGGDYRVNVAFPLTPEEASEAEPYTPPTVPK